MICPPLGICIVNGNLEINGGTLYDMVAIAEDHVFEDAINCLKSKVRLFEDSYLRKNYE